VKNKQQTTATFDGLHSDELFVRLDPRQFEEDPWNWQELVAAKRGDPEMPKIIIRHLTGARANQFDEFPISAAKELIVGRDLGANVRVDPDKDDLVSRQHLKIACTSDEPEGIQLIDLQSRNGTFLNHQRIYGAVHLSHNDIVQLGAGGPEFRFELDPPPVVADGPRPTREATFDPARFGAKPTRDAWSPAGPAAETAAAPSRPVGRATVERMLGEQFSKVKTESNKAVWIGVVGLLAIIALGLGGWFYLRQSRSEQIAEMEQNLAAQQRLAAELRKKSDAASVKELVRIDEDIQKQVAALRELKAKEDAKKAADEKQAAAKPAMAPIPPPQAPPTVTPVAAAAAAAGVDPNSSYDSLIDQATDKFQHGKTNEALDIVKVALAKDSSRWEGYEFAGQLAERLGDFTTANSMFEDALKWAPADNRQDIQFKLNALKEKLAAR